MSTERKKIAINITIDSDLNAFLSTLPNRSEFINESVREALSRKGKINSNVNELRVILSKDLSLAVEELLVPFGCKTKEEFFERLVWSALAIMGKNKEDGGTGGTFTDLAHRTLKFVGAIDKNNGDHK